MAKLKKELKKELDDLNVKYKSNATNKELEALLKAAKSDDGEVDPLVGADDEDTESTPEVDDKPVTDDAPAEDDAEDTEEEDTEEETDAPDEGKFDPVPKNSPKAESALVVEREMKKRHEETKKALRKERKVWFNVPLGENETKGSYIPVNINGYRLEVKKGVMVELPETVMKLLADHFNISTTAGEDFLISRDKKTEEALS